MSAQEADKSRKPLSLGTGRTVPDRPGIVRGAKFTDPDWSDPALADVGPVTSPERGEARGRRAGVEPRLLKLRRPVHVRRIDDVPGKAQAHR